MTPREEQVLRRLLLESTEIYGNEVSALRASMFQRLLAPYGGEDMRRAFYKHFQQSRYRPVPADIIALIDGSAENGALAAIPIIIDAMEDGLHDKRTLVPDGAAAMAIESLLPFRGKCGAVSINNRYLVDVIKARYQEFHQEGRAARPGTIVGLKSGDSSERDDFLFKRWWTPTDFIKHYRKLKEFQAVNWFEFESAFLTIIHRRVNEGIFPPDTMRLLGLPNPDSATPAPPATPKRFNAMFEPDEALRRVASLPGSNFPGDEPDEDPGGEKTPF